MCRDALSTVEHFYSHSNIFRTSRAHTWHNYVWFCKTVNSTCLNILNSSSVPPGCIGVTCQNGGVCTPGGVCSCVNGYSGLNCEGKKRIQNILSIWMLNWWTGKWIWLYGHMFDYLQLYNINVDWKCRRRKKLIFEIFDFWRLFNEKMSTFLLDTEKALKIDVDSRSVDST